MIKNNLSLLLGKRRLKMTEVAKKAGVNKNTILNLYHERTTKIDFSVIDKLCKVLGCQPGDILIYVPEKENVKEKNFLREYTDEEIKEFLEEDIVTPDITSKVNQLIDS
ncbi:MAG: helix-turn-helix transcriptional regulator [Candidatus Eremiobacterota bacterium]